MLRLIIVIFCISLIVLFGSITVSRLSHSTAFWLLTKQSTNQPRKYNYILSLPDGRASRIIASAADTTGNPNWFVDWLPDSNTILYLDHDVYALDVRSGTSQLIIETRGTVIGFDTLLSPAEDWLLLELRNSVNTELYRINSSGNNVQLIAEVLSVTTNMVWSSDGETIYFVNFSNDQFRPLATDGNTVTEVSWGERFEQISPDGQFKAFYEEGNQNVWQIEELTTGKVSQLTPPSGQYRLLDWLPNDWILLEEIQYRTSLDFDNTQRYFRIRPDGSELSPLFIANASFANRVAPFWTDEWFYVNSLDGERETLHRVNIETGESQILINNFLPFVIDEMVDFYDGTARIVRLVGDWIIWRTTGNDVRYMQTHLDSSMTREIYDTPPGARTPRLLTSPDKKWLYVTYRDRSGAWIIDRINLDNQDVQEVFAGDQSLLAISPIVTFDLQPYLFGLGILVILTTSILMFFK